MALQCGLAEVTRHAMRISVDDPDSPLNGYQGDTFTIEQSTVGAAGPWTDSLTTDDYFNDCTGSVAPRVQGGAAAGLAALLDVVQLTPGTHYWFRITHTASVNGHPVPTELICEDDTEALPSPPCALSSDVTETGVTLTDLVGPTPFFNAAQTCDLDVFDLDYGTVSGGPYPNTDTKNAADQIKSEPHVLTGLTPNTTYFYRTRVSNPIDGDDIFIGEECSFTTAAAVGEPSAACAAASAVTETSATLNGTADNAPVDGTVRISYGSTAGGPYPDVTGSAAGTDSAGQVVTGPAAGLTAGTQYYYIVEVLDAGSNVVASSAECTFTTSDTPPEPPVDGPIFTPADCGPGGGGESGPDVENLILCDVMPDGEIAGYALAVYEYDETGAPAGPPTFVSPTTGDPYVAQGALQPCPGETGCLDPVLFCFTTSTTGPVDHPGRMYDLTLPINPGFAVQSLQVDQVTSPANIVWDVSDPDGDEFAAELASFIEGRVPASATVTITNPNSGNVICGTADPMQIHIECVRLDQSPPDLIELIYNGGQDMVINPAYNEDPPLDPPVSQGNYGYHLLARQDDPGPFPGNQPSGRAVCTDVANRGWETNDVGRTFEIWGQNVAGGVTPTPRGTPIQEITSDGHAPGEISTIWQTFVAPASGDFIIRLVHGARDPGEIHRITLDNGDTDDQQNGTLIDNTTTPATVYGNPWTQFEQTIPLVAGQTYTLAFSSTNPAGPARGGLFTDMRAFINLPDQRETATTDDDTCVVTVEETTTVQDAQYWSPRCIDGDIVSWRNVETGAELDNAAFWGQAPSPDRCVDESSGGDGGSVAANLIHSYLICGTVGGVQQTLVRYVITDPSGGVLAEQIIGQDGGPVAPNGWQPGGCTDSAFVNDEILCDDNGAFLRKYVQTLSQTRQGQVQSVADFTLDGATYTPVGEVVRCSQPVILDTDIQAIVLCDQTGTSFLRTFSTTDGVTTVTDTELDGQTPYAPIGQVGLCQPETADREGYCYTLTSTGAEIHTGWVRHDDNIPATPQTPNGMAFFDNLGNLIDPTADGFTQVPCAGEPDCCPIVIGSGCATGDRKWTSIRDNEGVVTLLDQEDGSTVDPGDVVACTDDVALNAQSRLLADGESWTPGADVTGILTGVSFTVITGTGTVTDSDGTVASGLPPGVTGEWQSEDGNSLVGPQSIEAVGGNVWLTWTSR